VHSKKRMESPTPNKSSRLTPLKLGGITHALNRSSEGQRNGEVGRKSIKTEVRIKAKGNKKGENPEEKKKKLLVK